MTEITVEKKYNIIYADPPWSFRNKKTGGSMRSGASQHYDDMEMYELTGMVLNYDPVVMLSDVIADDCVLFMWWVGSMPKEALYLVDDWRFEIKTMTGFVWNKLTKHGKPFFGMGHWTRAGSECCLIATRGNPKRSLGNVRSVITAPAGKHSEKPFGVADRIVDLCGDLPRLELFARDTKPGWDSWGNEL